MYKFYEKIHLYSNSQDMNLIDLIQIFFFYKLSKLTDIGKLSFV